MYKLKQEKYKEGAKLGLENAKNLKEVSLAAAKLKNFGIASSLLVTALEELVKASMLKIKAIDNTIIIDDLDKFFKVHSKKQEQIVNLFFSHLKKDEIIPVIVTITIGIIVIVINSLFLDEKKEKNNFFEETRTNGLYLQFNKETSSWKTPNQSFGEKEYSEYLDTTNTLFQRMEQDFFSLTKESEKFIEILDLLQLKRKKVRSKKEN